MSTDAGGFVDFTAKRDDANSGEPAYNPDVTPHVVPPDYPDPSLHQPVKDMILDPETGKPIYVDAAAIRAAGQRTDEEA